MTCEGTSSGDEQIAQSNPENESEFRPMLRALEGNKIANPNSNPNSESKEDRKHVEESESF